MPGSDCAQSIARVLQINRLNSTHHLSAIAMMSFPFHLTYKAKRNERPDIDCDRPQIIGMLPKKGPPPMQSKYVDPKRSAPCGAFEYRAKLFRAIYQGSRSACSSTSSGGDILPGGNRFPRRAARTHPLKSRGSTVRGRVAFGRSLGGASPSIRRQSTFVNWCLHNPASILAIWVPAPQSVIGDKDQKPAFQVIRYTDPPTLANMRENGALALAAALLTNAMAAGSGSRYRKSVSCGLMPNLPPPSRLKSGGFLSGKVAGLVRFPVCFYLTETHLAGQEREIYTSIERAE